MWETKETLEGGLRIDRWWWVVAKAGAVVAVSALVALGMAVAFLKSLWLPGRRGRLFRRSGRPTARMGGKPLGRPSFGRVVRSSRKETRNNRVARGAFPCGLECR